MEALWLGDACGRGRAEVLAAVLALLHGWDGHGAVLLLPCRNVPLDTSVFRVGCMLIQPQLCMRRDSWAINLCLSSPKLPFGPFLTLGISSDKRTLFAFKYRFVTG